MTTINETLAPALLDLATATTDDQLDDCIDALADTILATADELTDTDIAAIMRTLLIIDPTLSTYAALIRDTIRDNTDFDFA